MDLGVKLPPLFRREVGVGVLKILALLRRPFCFRYDHVVWLEGERLDEFMAYKCVFPSSDFMVSK